VLAATESYRKIALDRLRRGQPPLALVYFEGLDEVNHRFAVYQPPPMRGADPAKAGGVRARHRQLLPAAGSDHRRASSRAASPDTIVMVVSDHGFASGDSPAARCPAGHRRESRADGTRSTAFSSPPDQPSSPGGF